MIKVKLPKPWKKIDIKESEIQRFLREMEEKLPRPQYPSYPIDNRLWWDKYC